MNYAILPKRIKNRYKIGSTRAVYHVPLEKFEDLTKYLHQQINRTKLGKIRAKHKKYSTFQEYVNKQSKS